MMLKLWKWLECFATRQRSRYEWKAFLKGRGI